MKIYTLVTLLGRPCLKFNNKTDEIFFTMERTRRDGRMSRDRKIGESELHRCEPWPSQNNDFKFGTFRFLARCSALLGKDWLAQC